MTGLAILGSGMVTALGYNAPATLAALRAGISAVRASAWTDFSSGEALRAAKVDLPQWWEGAGKLAELAAPAIAECLRAAQPEPARHVPLLLGVPAPHRSAGFDGIESLLEEISLRLQVPPHPSSALYPADQAGCVHALAQAHRLIEQGIAPKVVVAGVDSFLHQPMLDAYAERRRLMTPGNSNGFFPGEAACAVLVGPAEPAGPALRILGFGWGHEPATIESTEPLRAQGLTDAVRRALSSAGVALKDVAYRLTDLSGEHYKFKEAAFVAGRLNGGEREVPLDLWHPIEYLGEIGAAILPCLLAWADDAAEKGYAPGPLALCHVGSDAGERAALVVGRSAA